MRNSRSSLASSALALFLGLAAWSTYRLDASAAPRVGKGGVRLNAVFPRDPGCKIVLVNDPSKDTGEATSQQDASVAVSGQNVVVVYTDSGESATKNSTGISVSSDGGQTFTDLGSPLDTGGVGPLGDEPSVAADSAGNFYIATRAFSANAAAIGVYKSTDGGQTWGAPVFIPSANGARDPRITIDNTGGARDGRIYVSWSAPAATPAGYFLSQSSDGGATFSAPLAVPTTGAGTATFSWPVVGRDTGSGASVIVAWLDAPATGTSAIRTARSDDGGATFNTLTTKQITALRPYGRLTTIGGQQVRLMNGDIRADLQGPALAADRTSGALDGTIYAVFANGGARGDSDVVLSRSSNNGQTWSVPIRVHRDATNDQFMPSVAVTDDGRVHVLFYDRSRDPLNLAMDVVLATSTDGGFSWTEKVITPSSFLPRIVSPDPDPVNKGAYDLGEYIQVVSNGQNPVMVWSDSRSTVDSPTYGRRLDSNIYFSDCSPNDTPENPRARILIQHPRPEDLVVTVGSGPTDAPDFEKVVSNRQGLPGRIVPGLQTPFSLYTDVDISEALNLLPPDRNQRFWVKVEDQVAGSSGTVAAFHLILDQETYTSDDTPVSIPDGSGEVFAFIGAPNEAPIIDIQGDTTTFEGELVTLTATADDADDDIITYSWRQVSGPAVRLIGQNTPTLSFDAPSVPLFETLRFELTASDGRSTPVKKTFDVEVVAAPGATVSGNVTDAFGNPVVGARIVVLRSDGQAATVQTTDAFGDYTVDDVRVGRNTVLVSANGFESPLPLDVTLGAGALREVNFTLDQPTGSLEGTLRRFDGSPLAGATVQFQSGGNVIATVQTDGAGEFRLENLKEADATAGTLRVRHASVPEWVIGSLGLTPGEANQRNFQYGALEVKVAGNGKKNQKLVAGTRVQVLIGRTVIAQGTVSRNGGALRFTNIPAQSVRVTAGSAAAQATPVDVTVEPGRLQKVKVLVAPFRF